MGEICGPDIELQSPLINPDYPPPATGSSLADQDHPPLAIGVPPTDSFLERAAIQTPPDDQRMLEVGKKLGLISFGQEGLLLSYLVAVRDLVPLPKKPFKTDRTSQKLVS